MFFSLLFITICPDGPWTREIKSLDETIEAYSMLDSNEKKETYYAFFKNSINYKIININKKKNYLSYKLIPSLKTLTPLKKVIYHKKQLLSQ